MARRNPNDQVLEDTARNPAPARIQHDQLARHEQSYLSALGVREKLFKSESTQCEQAVEKVLAQCLDGEGSKTLCRLINYYLWGGAVSPEQCVLMPGMTYSLSRIPVPANNPAMLLTIPVDNNGDALPLGRISATRAILTGIVALLTRLSDGPTPGNARGADIEYVNKILLSEPAYPGYFLENEPGDGASQDPIQEAFARSLAGANRPDRGEGATAALNVSRTLLVAFGPQAAEWGGAQELPARVQSGSPVGNVGRDPDADLPEANRVQVVTDHPRRAQTSKVQHGIDLFGYGLSIKQAARASGSSEFHLSGCPECRNYSSAERAEAQKIRKDYPKNKFEKDGAYARRLRNDLLPGITLDMVSLVSGVPTWALLHDKHFTREGLQKFWH